MEKVYQVILYEFRTPPEGCLRSRARYLVILNRAWGALPLGGSHTGVPIQTFPSVLRTARTTNSAMIQYADAAGQRAVQHNAVPRGLRTLAGSCRPDKYRGSYITPLNCKKEEYVLLLLFVDLLIGTHSRYYTT